jgi:hypothetical protein
MFTCLGGPFEVFWSKIGCSEVISSCTVRQRTLDSQQSVKAVDGGHSCGIWAPWSIIKSPYNLGHHLKSRSQGIRVWNSSEVHSQSKTLEKSNLVNCGFNQWFDGWNWFEGAHSCSYKPHISCQTSSWKNLKSNRKFPEMETGPVTETYQKWKVLILKLTSWYKLQMNFCPTWKLKILSSHFQKVQEHPNPMCGCQDMIKSFSSIFELQRAISLKP